MIGDLVAGWFVTCVGWGVLGLVFRFEVYLCLFVWLLIDCLWFGFVGLMLVALI